MATQIERRQASTRSIVEAATQAIAEHGVGGFTIAEVSQATGLNRATIYYYFPKRRDLVVEALQHIMLEHAAVKPQVLELAVSERLRAHIGAPHVARFLLSLMLKREELPPPPPPLTNVRRLLKQGQSDGRIRPEVDIDVFTLLIFLMEITWAAGREALARQHGIALDEADARVIAELERIVGDVALEASEER